MAPSVMLSALLLVMAISPAFSATNSLPKDMHQDMYCIGCEMTMKVIDRGLRNTAKNQLAASVPEALRNVCKPDHFKIGEFSKDTMSDACKYIVKEYREELESVLVNFYSRDKRPSYLDVVQRVCMDLTDACHGVLHDHHNHDPLKDDAGLKLDPDTNEFVVVPGKNLKVAKPVVHVHDDL